MSRRKDAVIATKVPVPENCGTLAYPELSRIVNTSLDASLRALRRDVLGIVQVHNATIQALQQGDLLGCLRRAGDTGKLRWIGASVYGLDAALMVVRTTEINVLQVALSLLDQRMCGQVLSEAETAGIGVLTRSAMLKGALTKRAQCLPQSMQLVKRASEWAIQELGTTWEELPAMALRFCLTVPAADTVLVGVRNRAELQSCLVAESTGPLNPHVLKTAYTLALDDELLLNPTYWQLEESDIGKAHL